MSVLIRESRDNYWMLNWLDKFMEGHKGFICGGCFKNIFNQEKVIKVKGNQLGYIKSRCK